MIRHVVVRISEDHVMAGGLERDVAAADAVGERPAIDLVLLVVGHVHPCRAGRTGLIGGAGESQVVPTVVELQELDSRGAWRPGQRAVFVVGSSRAKRERGGRRQFEDPAAGGDCL